MLKRILILLGIVVIGQKVFCQTDVNPNGYNKLFYPNGSLQSEGYLKNGKPEGYWKNYYPTGVVKSEGSRKNHLLDSIWIFYSITGDTISKINYLNGKKNGYYYEYFYTESNATLRKNISKKELYVNNKKEGSSYYYFRNGKIKEICNYSNNLLDGKSTVYAEDGRMISINQYRKGSLIDRDKINRYNKEGNKENIWRTYYPNGKIRNEMNYKNGILDGYYKEYDANGVLNFTLLYRNGILIQDVTDDQIETEEKIEYFENGKIKATGFYKKDSKPIGLHKKYSREDSIIKATIYNDNSIIVSSGFMDDNGKRTGKWEEYYEDGLLKASGMYLNNLKEGKWLFYLKDGKIEQEGIFKRGKLSGLWTFYYSDGNIWKEEEYFNGLAEGSYTEYDSTGNVIVNGEYFDGNREGEWITVINDHKAVGKYVAGLMDGKWRYYFDNGSLHFEGNYVQGNADGKHKYYFPNGNLKEEQYFSSGIRQKHWKKYTEDGHLKITITYVNDKEYRINGVKVNFPVDLPLVIE